MNRINLHLLSIFSLYPIFGMIIYKVNMDSANVLFYPLLIALILTILDKKLVIYVPKYLFFFILFTIYVLIGDAVCGKGVVPFYLYQNRYIETVIILLLIENTDFNTGYLNKLLRNIRFIVIIAFIAIIIQALYREHFFLIAPATLETPLFINWYTNRYSSIFSWNGGGLRAGFSFIPFVALLMSDSMTKKKDTIVTSLYLMSLGFAFLCKARWVLLNAFLLGFMYLINYKKNKLSRIVVMVSVLSIVCFILLSIPKVKGYVNDVVYYRMLTLDRGGILEGSANARLLAFEMFKKFYPESPILGRMFVVGHGGYDVDLYAELAGRSSQVHVGFLSVFYYYGLIGGGLFLCFLYYLFRDVYKVSKLSNNWGIFLGLLCFAVANLTLVVFYLFYSGLIMCFIFFSYYKKQFGF